VGHRNTPRQLATFEILQPLMDIKILTLTL
jgi:hypothetical protein